MRDNRSEWAAGRIIGDRAVPYGEMTWRDKLRDAAWRYSPDRTEKIVTLTIIAGAAAMSVANWLRKGKVNP